ncbi:hypothetical protein FH972_001253 [Carpinus fangiana]|uniref:Uncharacterized protein n=1 Tax=Carpinus fangiana TaxID=176857 RepID=A0A5N6QB71_9ROSI|nr:hypothetical protein FH972_001253 [Carpinus fangiana]
MIKSSNIILAFYPRSGSHSTRKSELFPCCSIKSNKENLDLWVTLPEEIKGKKRRLKLTLQSVVALGVAGVCPGSRISFSGASCILWAALSSYGGSVDESSWLSVVAMVADGGGRT